MKFVDKIDEFFEQVWLWLDQYESNDNKHNDKGENSEAKSS